MKKIFIISSVILSLLFVSCKDNCKDVNCVHGSCDDGTCLCEQGYEGTLCDTPYNAKFEGSWTGKFNSNGEDFSNNVSIAFASIKDIPDQFRINASNINFDLTFNSMNIKFSLPTIECSLPESKEFDIKDFEITTTEGEKIACTEGYGSLTNDKVSFQFTYKIGENFYTLGFSGVK